MAAGGQSLLADCGQVKVATHTAPLGPECGPQRPADGRDAASTAVMADTSRFSSSALRCGVVVSSQYDLQRRSLRGVDTAAGRRAACRWPHAGQRTDADRPGAETARRVVERSAIWADPQDRTGSTGRYARRARTSADPTQSGRHLPERCQGEGRAFESRHPLHVEVEVGGPFGGRFCVVNATVRPVLAGMDELRACAPPGATSRGAGPPSPVRPRTTARARLKPGSVLRRGPGCAGRCRSRPVRLRPEPGGVAGRIPALPLRPGPTG